MNHKVTDRPKIKQVSEAERVRLAREESQRKRRSTHPVSQPATKNPRMDPGRPTPSAKRPKKPDLREPVRSTVEPLLLERRRQVSDDGRQRQMFRLKLAGALSALAVLGTALLFSPLFNIDKIDISGESLLSAKDIEAISGLTHRSALVSTDTRAAEAALRADPWIAFAKVRRSYPATMQVTVAEEIPVIAVTTSTGSALVSKNGRVLEFAKNGASLDEILLAKKLKPVPAEFAGDLLSGSLKGSDVRGKHVSADVEDLVRFARHLTPVVRDRLSVVRVGPKGDIELQLSDESVVLVGPPEAMSAKISAIESVLGQVDLRCLAQIDVRNPTRATIMRTPGCDLDGP